MVTACEKGRGGLGFREGGGGSFSIKSGGFWELGIDYKMAWAFCMGLFVT